MAAPVKGFLTADGVYYPSKPQAERHEFANTIKELCDSHTPQPINSEKLIDIIEAWADPIKDYINAYEACIKEGSAKENPRSTRRHQADDADGNADFASLVEQQVGRHKPVPDVGDGS